MMHNKQPWAGAAMLLALACAASPATAEMLYKCVGPSGIATIQQERCPKGSTQAWARDTAPEPPPTPEQVAAAQARAEAAEQERARAQADFQERVRQEEEAAALAEMQEEAEAAEADVDAEAAEQPPAAPTAAPVLDKCEEAKQFAARMRAMPWLELDSRQQRGLWGWVIQECSGDG